MILRKFQLHRVVNPKLAGPGRRSQRCAETETSRILKSVWSLSLDGSKWSDLELKSYVLFRSIQMETIWNLVCRKTIT